MTPERGCERFSGRDVALLHRWWRPEAPTRRLVVVHGLAEHSERYDYPARRLAERGCAVHALDLRGHGESEGPRAYAPGFDWLLDDLEHFLARVESADPSGPLVLLGHSMGGLLVGSLLARRLPAVRAAVLSAPPLAPSLPVLKRALIHILGLLAPRLAVPGSIDPEGLSSDPDVVRAYVEDERIPKRYSARLLRELLAAVRWLEPRAAAIEVPVLLVHGEADPICPAQASERFARGLRAEGSQLLVYPGMRHEVLNEPERDRVIDDIAEWLEKHAA